MGIYGPDRPTTPMACSSIEARQGTVGMASADLVGAVTDLEEYAGRLFDRLRPVVSNRPTPCDPENKAKCSPSCDLEGAFRDAADRVRAVRDKISTVLDALEL